MIVHDVQQGTTEWLELRAGIPTASQFDLILTPGGKPSKSAERYLYTLLAERCMGHPIVEHVSNWMQRGNQLEQDAVAFYELQADADTVPVGFVTTDDGRIGASPDRLVGDDGLLEIKCPSEYIHMGYALKLGSAYENYKVQVQGQMMVTKREFVDVVSFHPELPTAVIRIERDDKYIALLEPVVEAFSLELERQFEMLVAQGWMSHGRKEAPPQSASQIMREILIERNAQVQA
jgi:putative phage-type endonuclease